MVITSTSQAPARGRPPRITQERIVEAGIRIGLPNLTLVGMANALGVSTMALYKHVPSLDALKRLVAEAIFQRWQIPLADADADKGLQRYLMTFIEALCALVKANPGLPPYLLRRSAASQAMLDKIAAHQQHIARVHALPLDRARWLLATLAFYCIAGADTVYSVVAGEADARTEAERAAEDAEVIAEFQQGMHALVIGTLKVLEEERATA